MFELVVMYVAGTAAGLLAFRAWIKERIITDTLDMLIKEEYLRSWIDEDGITQLYKWHEYDHEVLQSLMDELENLEIEEENEKDDTP